MGLVEHWKRSQEQADAVDEVRQLCEEIKSIAQKHPAIYLGVKDMLLETVDAVVADGTGWMSDVIEQFRANAQVGG